jgi:hypothetical protein
MFISPGAGCGPPLFFGFKQSLKVPINKIIALILILCFIVPLGAREKREPDLHLQAIHSVFVKGNNEAAIKAREGLERWTCYSPASDCDKADAVLEIEQQMSVNRSILSSSIERAMVSATLTNKAGDLIWSKTSSQDSGWRHTGAGSAAQSILVNLHLAGYPDVKISLHAVKRAGRPGQ